MPTSEERVASSSATTRIGAARLTRACQVGTVALACVGVAAFLFGVPGTTPEKPRETLELPRLDPIARPKVAARGPTPNVLAVADRFGTIANAPRQPAPVVDTSATGPSGMPATPPPPPPPPDNIRYLGHVGLGSALYAMINEDQRQRVVGVNDEVAAGRVVEITPEELTLDRDGTRKVIALATRSGSSISTIQPISAGNTRGVRGGPRGAISPEALMSRPRPSEPVVMLNADTQRRQQAWDTHFATATNRLMESGQFKDDDQAKLAAARYAEEMVKVEEEIIQGADPETIEKRRKDLDEMLSSGGIK